MSQLQHLFATPGGGPVNWDLARQIAQAHLTGVPGGRQVPFGLTLPAGAGPTQPAPSGDERTGPVGDPGVTSAERAAVAEALRLADLWLEPGSALPSGISATAA